MPSSPPEPIADGLDLTSCDREPIHLLGTVQPFGVLLAATTDGIIRYVSDNAAAHLGMPPAEVLGRPLHEVLERQALHDIRGRLQVLHGHGQTERIFGLELVKGRGHYDVAVHIQPGLDRLTVIEAEPSSADPGFDPVSTVKGMMARLLRTRDMGAFYDQAARQLRAVLGFDRVMVYRFHHDGAGEVVGESMAGHLEPYRGLHYPASDIPRQARALYCRNWLRLIADVNASPAPLVALQGGAPLDLSDSVLRSVSPIHLEYLRNMGVGASLSVSVMRGTELWGLLACHNATPIVPGFQRRSTAELFGQLFSLQVETLERAEVARYEADARAVHDRVLAAISSGGDMLSGFAHVAAELRAVVPCDGVAICFGGETEVSGQVPDREQMAGLVAALNQMDTSHVLAADNIARLHPPAAAHAAAASGMLVVPISRLPRDYLIFFRRELVRSVTWAGDPTKPVEPGTGLLHPRQSFAAWREEIRGHSAPWTEPELRMAESLRITLLEVVLRLAGFAADQSRAAHERQELLIAELNHRVRNTLSLIRALVSRSRESAGSLESFVEVLNGRIQSLARAHDQLTVESWGPVQLRGMIEGEFEAYLGDAQRQRTSVVGPDVQLEPQALTVLALAVHELATNAAKYGALSDGTGRVEVRWAVREDGSLHLTWCESGGPRVRVPNRRGFGSTVIERSVPFELQGSATLRYETGGVQADFSVPARFVRLGAGRFAPTATSRQAASASTPVRPSGTALVLEDSTLLALDAEDILRELGFERVEVTGSVAAAKAMLDRLDGALSFALLDVNLGDSTSLPVAEELRRLGVPFGFATGYGASVDLPADIKDHAQIIQKPYRRQDIADLVARSLRPGPARG
ncbi:HWE histidine kinase domain-containing protein [Dankookia sp. P2]|uniref:HWE histidine kinase domain-containing protein n=1 Tax=Dankookia sp. P2 TaxID=3423955 RepID=UPI003D66B1D4